VIVGAANGVATATYAVTLAASSDTDIASAVGTVDNSAYTLTVAYGTTPGELALTSTDGSTQSYSFEDTDSNPVGDSTALATGDVLIVTAANTWSGQLYHITVGPAPDAANSTVTASSDLVPGDGQSSSTITVTVKDADGNPLQGVTVTLAGNSGSVSTISTTPAVTDSSGVATFTVSDSWDEPVIYTATAGGVAITETAQVSFMPYLTSATYSPGTLTLTFSAAVHAADVTAADFTYVGSGTLGTVAYVSGSGTLSLELSLTGETITTGSDTINTVAGQTDIAMGGGIAPAPEPVTIY